MQVTVFIPNSMLPVLPVYAKTQNSYKTESFNPEREDSSDFVFPQPMPDRDHRFNPGHLCYYDVSFCFPIVQTGT